MSGRSPQNKPRFNARLIRMFFLALMFSGSAGWGQTACRLHDGVLLREGPGNYYPLIRSLDSGIKFEVIDSSRGWLKVAIEDDGEGWISSSGIIQEGASQPAKDQVQPGAVPKITVDRAAVGAMIKGLKFRMGVDEAVPSPFDPPVEVTAESVDEFRGAFDSWETPSPVAVRERRTDLLKTYLALSPLIAEQQIQVWGGHDWRLEMYCNQILLWLSDRAGAFHLMPRVLVAVNGNNEFVLPMGWIVLGGDLLSNARNEAELAGIIGHELAHAYFRHGEQGLEKEFFRIKAADAFAELARETGEEYDEELADLEEFSVSAIQFARRKYSIDNELTADSAATCWLRAAGYDPGGLLEFLKRTRTDLGEGLVGQRADFNLIWLNSREELDRRIDCLEKQVKKLRKKRHSTALFKTRFRQYVGR